MIEEDYVSFKTAKLLKEKGFNEETEYVFSNNEELLRLSHFGIKDLTNDDCDDYHTWQFSIEGVASIISAPTLQMAMKWLREVHELYIEVSLSCDREDKNAKIFDASIFNVQNQRYKKLGNIQGYEEACEAAIKYCLENLI